MDHWLFDTACSRLRLRLFSTTAGVVTMKSFTWNSILEHDGKETVYGKCVEKQEYHLETMAVSYFLQRKKNASHVNWAWLQKHMCRLSVWKTEHGFKNYRSHVGVEISFVRIDASVDDLARRQLMAQELLCVNIKINQLVPYKTIFTFIRFLPNLLHALGYPQRIECRNLLHSFLVLQGGPVAAASQSTSSVDVSYNTPRDDQESL